MSSKLGYKGKILFVKLDNELPFWVAAVFNTSKGRVCFSNYEDYKRFSHTFFYSGGIFNKIL